MNFSFSDFPDDLNLEKRDIKEVRLFKSWFLDTLDERMSRFFEVLRSYRNYEDWQGDYSVASLKVLGRWFYERMHENATKDINHIQKTSIDVGLYLCLVLIKHGENNRWRFTLTRKRSLDYGQPDILTTGKLLMNPIRICAVVSQRMARDADGEEAILGIYNEWVDKTRDDLPDCFRQQ